MSANFRHLPKAMQTSVDHSYHGNDQSQLDILQTQLHQVTTMMNKLMNNKGFKSPEDNFYGARMAGMGFSHNVSITKTMWIIDSGATDHMCNQLSIMQNVHTLSHPVHLSLPTGTVV